MEENFAGIKQRIEQQIQNSGSSAIGPASRRKQLMHQLNKSSSSGTTSSSTSNATQEFLARLRRMEMPVLKRPPPAQQAEEDTSADLRKVKELDSSEPRRLSKKDNSDTVSSFNISGGGSEVMGKTFEDQISHLSLSSSASSSPSKTRDTVLGKSNLAKKSS